MMQSNMPPYNGVYVPGPELKAMQEELAALRSEVKCLRSVLSEFPGDKMEFAQMEMANFHREQAVAASTNASPGGES